MRFMRSNGMRGWLPETGKALLPPAGLAGGEPAAGLAEMAKEMVLVPLTARTWYGPVFADLKRMVAPARSAMQTSVVATSINYSAYVNRGIVT